MRLQIENDNGDILFSTTMVERGFTTGSLGYHATAKVTVDGKPYSCNFGAIQEHSKELPGAGKVAAAAKAEAARKIAQRAARPTTNNTPVKESVAQRVARTAAK